MSKLYVMGHKSPDTDSVCSAIAYANLKRKLGLENCYPAILGKINEETKFVLKHFNVEEPELIKSVKTQIKDIEYYNTITITEETTVKKAYDVMISTESILQTIVDKEDKLVGIVSIKDIMEYNMKDFEENTLKGTNTTIENIRETISANIIYGEENKDDIINGKIIIYDNIGEKIDTNSIVIIRKDTKDISEVYKNNPKCIIVKNTFKIKNIPENFKGIIMSTSMSAFNIIRNVNMAIPVKNIMKTGDIVCFKEDETVEDVKKTVISLRYKYFPVIDEQKHVLGILSQRHLINNKNKEVILVDHNETKQSADGIEQAKVLEVIDHHRIGDIESSLPIYYRSEPVGCTSTIIAKMYEENDIEIENKIAGLLLSAILSDTLLFKSTTCTPMDIKIAKKLGEILKIDIEEYGKEMLYSGSDISNRTIEDLVNGDAKEFSQGDIKIAVTQIQIVDNEQFEAVKEDVMNYAELVCKERKYKILVVSVTNILTKGTEMFYIGELGYIVKEVFDPENKAKEGTTGYIEGIVSRKAQIVPPILNRLAQM